MKNKLTTIIIAIVTITILGTTAYLLLQGTKKPTATVASDSTNTQIIIGLDDAYPPMGFRDDGGNLIGFDIDLAKAVFKKLGYTPVFKPVDWEGVILTLQNKESDVIWSGLTITESRKEQIAFSIPYIYSNDIYIVKKDSDYSSAADLKGKTVAVQAGSSQAETLNTSEIGKTMTIKTYSSNDEAFLDLKAGRVDALLADGYSGRYYLTTLSSSENIYASIDSGFEKSYAAVGLRKEDTALKADIDGALSELISNGTASDISRTWFGEDIIVK